ncbi:hypothetical protein PILCRDRAFT_59483 [Piloderma croceum F 1598]|uniref:DUF7719 domain-containing protein n=1 Tax=Piloderma croceum (strain F 1598) TaxID=765440 RepID=A0A0C3G363_PILCF|nr:hypothetical protein PILCRDRAFT_59483 [Piloderma croceum F 1598]
MVERRKATTKTPEPPQELEISEDEQWRLINETGILKEAIPRRNTATLDSEDTPLAEEIFGAVTLIIPFSFLLFLFDILIHHQYGRQPTFGEFADRLIPSVPILSVFIFYTTRYKHTRKMQAFFFSLSLIIGPRMLWLISRGSWLVNMQQCPPLATIWVYTIVQLDLLPAVVGLTVVAGWVKWQGLKFTS